MVAFETVKPEGEGRPYDGTPCGEECLTCGKTFTTRYWFVAAARSVPIMFLNRKRQDKPYAL